MYLLKPPKVWWIPWKLWPHRAMAGKRPCRTAAALQSTPAPKCIPDKLVVPARRVRTRRSLLESSRVVGTTTTTTTTTTTSREDGSSGVLNVLPQPATGRRRDERKRQWRSLGVSAAELSLPLTFLTGQSFRWRSTGLSQYTGVVGSHLISLRQSAEDAGISFLLHNAHEDEATHRLAERELRDYLNLGTCLEKLYEEFTVADVRFAAVAPYLAGARLLHQNPLECLYQFICSSNNHIQRISGMVEYLASRGPWLGTVQGLRFHAFPSLAELSGVTEEQLRRAGFGYRAKFIVGTTEALRRKDGGGEQWLMSLRSLSLEDAVKSLCSLPGVGPKVAACIALFSLDQHHAIPVDTHVWQIAVRYLLPELAGKSLTLKLHQEVQDAFFKRFGKYAGWAHTVLFISELSSQQALLPEHLRRPPAKKEKVGKAKAILPLSSEEDEMNNAREDLGSELLPLLAQPLARKQKKSIKVRKKQRKDCTEEVD